MNKIQVPCDTEDSVEGARKLNMTCQGMTDIVEIVIEPRR